MMPLTLNVSYFSFQGYLSPLSETGIKSNISTMKTSSVMGMVVIFFILIFCKEQRKIGVFCSQKTKIKAKKNFRTFIATNIDSNSNLIK